MLALANRTFRMLPVTGSLNRFVPVYTASDVYYPLTEGELVKARVELPERVEAPIQGGNHCRPAALYAGRRGNRRDLSALCRRCGGRPGRPAACSAGCWTGSGRGRPTRWRRSAAAGSLIRICKKGGAAMEERLQKILSAHGVSSRRAAEGYLSAGRVTVNGCTARVGDKADPERDDIRVDGGLAAARPPRLI